MRRAVYFRAFSFCLPIAAAIAITTPAQAAGNEPHEAGPHIHRHHISGFAGGVYERTEGGSAAFGLDYMYRLPYFGDYISIGALFETTTHVTKPMLFAVPFQVHPYKGLRVIVAPGFEVSHREHKWTPWFLLRAGGAYDIHFGSWAIGPEMYADFSRGEIAGIFGGSLGYGF